MVLHWQHTLEQRQKIEEKYPELAGDNRPVLAHEGPYAAEPLRAAPPSDTDAAGHTHPHPHIHPHPAQPAPGPTPGQPSTHVVRNDTQRNTAGTG